MSRPAGRPLHFHERFLFVGGRHTWNVLLAARREEPLDEASLRAALVRLQRRHPMLQAAIVHRATGPAFTFPEPPVPIGLRIARHLGGEAVVEAMQAELERPFDVSAGPLARLVWIRAERSSELLLVTHHCICDGRSNQILMRDLLAALDRPGDDTAPGRNPRALPDLLGGPATTAERLAHRVLAAAAGGLLRLVTARIRTPGEVRPPNYIFAWVIDAALSGALAKRCAAERVTRYTAIATALLRAFCTVRPQARHRLLCPIDMRSLLPSLGAETLFGFADTVRLAGRPDPDFWTEARALRAELAHRRKRLRPRRKLLACEHLHCAVDRLLDLLLHGRAGEDIMFSDLGRADVPANRCTIAFAASVPWQGATALFSVGHGDATNLCVVSRETHLAQSAAKLLCEAASVELRHASTPSRATPTAGPSEPLT